MNSLADFTASSLLVSNSKSQTANSLLLELCSLMKAQGRLRDTASFYEALLKREKLSPTSFVPGWALPHARVEKLPKLCLTVASMAKPITWFGDSKALIKTIVLFAVPEAEAQTYLSLIAAVARLSQNAPLVDELMSARDGMGMLRVLQRVPLRQPKPAMTNHSAPGVGLSQQTPN